MAVLGYNSIMLTSNDKKKRILIVDDNMPMRKMLETMLVSIGFNNIAASIDGEAGWLKIQEGDIDIVVSDYIMPKLNGLELLHRIRKSKEFFTLPFIMVTGADKRGEFINTLQAEVDSYLIKPITAGALEESILQLISQQKSSSPYLKVIHAGKHNYIHGDLEKSLQNYLLAQALMPEIAKPYYYIGKINCELGRDDQAEMFLQRCVEIEEGYINAIIELAGICTRRRDYPRMYTYLEKALEVSPGNIGVYLDLATAAYKLDNMTEVRANLKKAAKFAKNQKEEVAKVIDAYIEVGLLDKADYLYGTRLEGDDDQTVKFWNLLGLAAKKMGNWDKAKHFYMSALRLQPQNKIVNYNIGHLLFEMGELDSAKAYLSKILRLHSDFKQAEKLMSVLRKRLAQ